jgi:23S rRNA (uridine2552-2'-O)-methyltransferase
MPQDKILSAGKRNLKKNKIKKKRLSVSSKNWLRRQMNDPYVAEAKVQGYRARSAFKIVEIDNKFKIFKKGRKVLDLGSAPGGWSQVAVKKVGAGNVLGTDILDMKPIAGVKFVQQDFLAPEAPEVLMGAIGGDMFDVAISDLASNTTGNKKVDHLRTTVLLEEAFDFAIKVLKEGGVFVGKVFQGGTEPELFNKVKKYFKIVKHFKPKSSRKDSVETYIVAMGFKGLK